MPRKPRWPPRDSSSTRPSPGPAGACLQTVLGGGGGGRGGKPQPQPARGRMTTERMDTEEAPARRSGLALTGWGGAGPAAPAQHRAPEVRARSRPGWLREASSSASASGPLPLPSPAASGGADGGSFPPPTPTPTPHPQVHDFRGFEHLGEGLGWRQQTREREAARLEQEAADAAANLAADEAKERAMGRQLRKRLKTSSTVGMKSGRPWKNPGSRAAGQKVDFGKKQERKAAWDAKMKRRAEDKAWKAKLEEINEEKRQAVLAEKRRRAEKQKLKEENTKLTGMKLQAIDPKKVKKMSKKQYQRTTFVMIDPDQMPGKSAKGFSKRR